MAQLPASGPQQREAEMPAGGRRRDRDHKGRGRGRDGPPGAARAATAGTLVAVTPESEGGTRRPAASAAWVAAAVAAAMAATSRTVPPMSAAGTKAPAAATAAVTAAAAAAATVGKAAAAAGAALTVDESSWASATCRATAAVRRQCAADSLSQKRPQAALWSVLAEQAAAARRSHGHDRQRSVPGGCHRNHELQAAIEQGFPRPSPRSTAPPPSRCCYASHRCHGAPPPSCGRKRAGVPWSAVTVGNAASSPHPPRKASPPPPPSVPPLRRLVGRAARALPPCPLPRARPKRMPGSGLAADASPAGASGGACPRGAAVAPRSSSESLYATGVAGAPAAEPPTPPPA